MGKPFVIETFNKFLHQGQKSRQKLKIQGDTSFPTLNMAVRKHLCKPNTPTHRRAWTTLTPHIVVTRLFSKKVATVLFPSEIAENPSFSGSVNGLFPAGNNPQTNNFAGP
jgi:hypothetical protein